MEQSVGFGVVTDRIQAQDNFVLQRALLPCLKLDVPQLLKVNTEPQIKSYNVPSFMNNSNAMKKKLEIRSSKTSPDYSVFHSEHTLNGFSVQREHRRRCHAHQSAGNLTLNGAGLRQVLGLHPLDTLVLMGGNQLTCSVTLGLRQGAHPRE